MLCLCFTAFLVFHYLPVLWYRYPIPNDIREFWYKERPDILEYMQKAYKDLEIQFLPDNIVDKLNQQTLTTKISSIQGISDTNIKNYISTEIFSKENLIQTENFLANLNYINEQFSNLFINHSDRFL